MVKLRIVLLCVFSFVFITIWAPQAIAGTADAQLLMDQDNGQLFMGENGEDLLMGQQGQQLLMRETSEDSRMSDEENGEPAEDTEDGQTTQDPPMDTSGLTTDDFSMFFGGQQQEPATKELRSALQIMKPATRPVLAFIH